ncbi:hypothetical protein [Corynebacterium epidermidicanis]|uniref:Cutinase n=1 Tax=Corynebacterium epidermidicanis TaxID=1050174 RepID=A0A0G3GY67_9CORY|nr:hypothetical protein [Corynebacterium epidermidicanis]AKK03772.1 Cutinase [Corynebacterium epidermidicanis]
MKKLLRATGAFLAALTSVVAGAVVSAPVAGAQERCPAVVILAARGSGQNGGYEWQQTQYGASPWVSNGREGSTIRSFLHHVEAVHQRDTGTSLMGNVQVIGIDERAYPARFPEGDFPQPNNVSEALSEFKNLVIPRAQSFVESISIGRVGSEATVRTYEATTGCRPQYLLVGFSQGATVITKLETTLAREGKLAGAVYMGSPYTRADDPHRFGSGLSGDGVLAKSVGNASRVRSNDKRLEYCVQGDVWCDFNARKVINKSVDNPWGHNQYFVGSTPFPGDRDEVARRVAGFIHAVG